MVGCLRHADCSFAQWRHVDFSCNKSVNQSTCKDGKQCVKQSPFLSLQSQSFKNHREGPGSGAVQSLGLWRRGVCRPAHRPLRWWLRLRPQCHLPHRQRRHQALAVCRRFPYVPVLSSRLCAQGKHTRVPLQYAYILDKGNKEAVVKTRLIHLLGAD